VLSYTLADAVIFARRVGMRGMGSVMVAAAGGAGRGVSAVRAIDPRGGVRFAATWRQLRQLPRRVTRETLLAVDARAPSRAPRGSGGIPRDRGRCGQKRIPVAGIALGIAFVGFAAAKSF